MERFKSHARTAGLAVCSAMAVALLAGCAGHTAVASADKAMRADESGVQADKGIARLEAQVAKSPRNASARVDLAQAYLAAGRFQSAVTTFEDAVSLGEDNPRIGLGQALAYIGAGRNAEALAVLNRWHAQIPASDFGLALALAGQPTQGVEVLSDAVRSGGNAANVAKTRQNLAYAYALDGRWSEARVVASQDVPADQLDARMSEWASHVLPEQSQARVASLLGAPMRVDAGQPAALALNGVQQPSRMAAAEAPAPAAELPPAETSRSVPQTTQPVQEVAATPAPTFDHTFATSIPSDVPAKTSFVPQQAARSTIKFGASARGARAQVPARATAGPAKGGTHLVQLGSFSSMEGAKRAWGVFVARNPALKDHAMRISEAQVNGHHFFRVAAGGFERGSAKTMCSSVRQRGGVCFAYADTRAVPGLKAGKVQAGPMLAQR